MCLLFCYNISAQINSKKNKSSNHNPASENVAKRSLIYQTIASEQNTFGYDILDHGKPLVHQPSVPGMPGNRGFANRKDAAKCAELVIKKINLNIMPPTITRHELDSLKN
ncbi:MAG: DUF4907 domain-containing protein [Chitinophagaceae bacterium]|nr:DUF4907 domain-containing protein [Chitinophagaceae bacterium]